MTTYTSDVMLEVLRTLYRGGRLKRSASVMSHLRARLSESGGVERIIDYQLVEALDREHYVYCPRTFTDDQWDYLFLTPEGRELVQHKNSAPSQPRLL